MEENQQQIDHYDYINAPQFVDFDDLAAQDDPDADKFFETHREEDDFMIPVDINAISPTVQLLYNETDNEHYSNQANEAAHAAGLQDVKFEYYASPKQSLQTSNSQQTLSRSPKKRPTLTSMYGTPDTSAAGSFYTPPTGEEEDKENETPLPTPGLETSKNHGDLESDGKGQREILVERSMPILGNSGISKLQHCASPEGDKKTANHGKATESSLMSKLNQLHIVDSDDDDDDSDFNSAEVQPMPQQADSSSSIEMNHMTHQNDYSTFNKEKLEYLGFSPTISSEAEYEAAGTLVALAAGDESPDSTIIIQPDSTEFEPQPVAYHKQSDSDSDTDGGRSTPIELEKQQVQDILKKLSLMDLDDEDDDDAGKKQELRSSIVVAPSVGQQVHWRGGTPKNLEQRPRTSRSRAVTQEEEESGAIGEDAVLSSSPEESDDDFEYTVVSGNRSSSHNNLLRSVELEPKERNFKTYGFNPRLGITIPKTPETDRFHSENNYEGVVAAEGNKNSCYFEIEAPKPSLRRASSCSDLRAHHYEHKSRIPSTRPPKLKPVQKKPLTVPKTPDAMKRAPKVRPSALSTSHNVAAKKVGSNLGDRLADTGSRQPVKANHYVSMAEAMINFQKNTPDRFRSLPKGRLAPQKRSTSCDARKRTQPSPTPSPDSRFHGNSFNEKKAHVKYPKANVTGPILPKKVELKTTIPQPFNFGSTHRSKPVPVKEVVDFKFKARPVPSNVLMDKTVLAKPKTKVTLPVAPHFASDDRIRERHQKMAQIETAAAKSPELKTSKNVPAQRSRIPTAAHSSNKSQVDEHKTTVAQPFSSNFEARQKAILRRKEDKVKELEEGLKTGREFHANPAPKFPGKLPKKKPTEVTHAEPFRLQSDERGEAYQRAFKKKVEEELQQLKEQAEFHAKSADVIHRAPFEPERPTRIIEGPMDFHLATERRAAERENFDEHIREKEREEEERRRQEQEMLEEAQRQEDIERRRQMVHKAQPFKDPKPFQLKSSSRPLTVPESPAFSAMPSERRIKP